MSWAGSLVGSWVGSWIGSNGEPGEPVVVEEVATTRRRGAGRFNDQDARKRGHFDDSEMIRHVEDSERESYQQRGKQDDEDVMAALMGMESED